MLKDIYAPYTFRILSEIWKYGERPEYIFIKKGSETVKIYIVGNIENSEKLLKLEWNINRELKKEGNNIPIQIEIAKKYREEFDDSELIYTKEMEKNIEKKDKNLSIITYRTDTIEKTKRARMSIELFGQKIRRIVSGSVKIYEKKGIIEKIKGKRLRNALLVPKKDTKEVLSIFNKYGVPHEKTDIYINNENFITKK